jgi:hypothetical protein
MFWLGVAVGAVVAWGVASVLASQTVDLLADMAVSTRAALARAPSALTASTSDAKSPDSQVPRPVVVHVEQRLVA